MSSGEHGQSAGQPEEQSTERAVEGTTDGTAGSGRLLAGRYRVVGRLGRGGMGIVWRAVDEVLGREVAVKELRTFTDAAAPELAALRLRMQREARAAARIRHPGVVAVHDVTEVDGRPLIVMELVNGRSLDDVLSERGTLDPHEAAGIGAQVMDALAAAHRVGVLHRDVKPGNILLEASGRVVLTDFGIATMEDPGDGSATHLTRSGELVGSLDYLAPERAQGKEFGPASDIWALGATLYAAVEGTSPFRRTSTWSTLTAIVAEPLPDPRQAGALAPVLRQLMAKGPEERPDAETARGLLAAVASATSGATDTPTTGLRSYGPVAAGASEAPGVAEAPEAGADGEADKAAASGAPSEPPGSGPAERTSPAPGAAQPQQVPPGFGPPEPMTSGTPGFGPAGYPAAPGAPDPGHLAAPTTFSDPAPASARPRRRGRALLAAVAVTVVLAAAGVTVALVGGEDDSEASTRPVASEDSPAAPSTGSGRADLDLSDPTPTGKGTGKSPSPSAPGNASAAEPGGDTATPAASATSGSGTTGGGTSGDAGTGTTGGSGTTGGDGTTGGTGTTGGSTTTGGATSTPDPACVSRGDGKYDCSVWRTAKSYTASGTEVGVLNAGTNYFYCQQNLGRRETYGEWTNVWWAKTDDDSGNAGVYVSDVYLKGGDNDAPVPGLPVC
ncbi:protein kinase domain-containing protein [Streptomyces sp. NBC_01451]|uniref:serine/threonine-protein kinase n=1 Tax=Streptomyces sp. NBC_01451 TaxID=2903872 RepID=UPI003FCE5088